ncbi:MAG TPA: efflux RND transporter periplasmic adaptor subunit [Candidatus Kryptobacter bacterium]|nr:efflux RND transporter periplasmic adaptor subunit [Candidatus Kryptobacter bacterium]
MKLKKVKVISISSAVLLGAVIVLRLYSQATPDKKIEFGKAVSVNIARVQYGTMTTKIRGTGALEGIHEAEIISETAGKVVSIDADLDTRLPANGRIARVENELQAISLEQARAQTAAAQANKDKSDLDLKRVKNLYAQNAMSESQMENAELAAKAAMAQLKSAQAAERLAQKHFDDTILRTPVAGRLAQKFITIGMMISPGTKVATVVDDSRMKLEVGVSEQSVSTVYPGNRVEITSDAVAGGVFIGTVKSVALKADPVTRTFQVEIEFPNDRDRSMKSGMFARVVITTSVRDSALVVPAAALFESPGSEYSVFVVSDSRAAKKAVSVGARTDSLVEVTSGLALGDTVVTFGQQNLKDGTIVRFKNSD